jgi:hypothetical protein
MHSRVTSDFLVAQPSFVSGVARLLDLYGFYDAYNTSRTVGEADYKALLSDWCIVGQDIQDAMTAFECSLPAEKRKSAQIELFAAR